MPPEDISEEMICPRFSMLPCYAEKAELEVGMDIRLKWNAKYNRCKARIMGVSANCSKMSDLFDQLDQQRKEKVTKIWRFEEQIAGVEKMQNS